MVIDGFTSLQIPLNLADPGLQQAGITLTDLEPKIEYILGLMN